MSPGAGAGAGQGGAAAGLGRALLGGLLELVFPDPFAGRCAFCGRPLEAMGAAHGLCRACWTKAVFPPGPRCSVCDRPVLGHGQVCEECRTHPRPFVRVHAAGLYAGDLQAAIQALKYGHRRELAPVLAGLVIHRLSERLDPAELDLVVPVPLHPSKERARGFNQSTLVARSVAAGLGAKCGGAAIIRNRPTQSQSRLAVEERWTNVVGAFAVVSPVAVFGKRVLVVDDVFTTGATATAVTHALLDAGAAWVELAVIAAAMPHGGLVAS